MPSAYYNQPVRKRQKKDRKLAEKREQREKNDKKTGKREEMSSWGGLEASQRALGALLRTPGMNLRFEGSRVAPGTFGVV